MKLMSLLIFRPSRAIAGAIIIMMVLPFGVWQAAEIDVTVASRGKF